MRPEERRVLERHLSPAEVELFDALEIQDQRHSLDVFFDLQAAGIADADLLAAALLHDVGKANVGLGTLHRTLIVLLRAISPGLVDAVASPNKRSRRYPFWIHRRHGEVGAHMLAQAGARHRVVELVRTHQKPPANDRQALALQQADNRH